MSDLLRYIPTTADLVINIRDYEAFIKVAKQEEQDRIRKVLQAEADRASNEEYKRAFLQFLADLPYTAEELFGDEKQK